MVNISLKLDETILREAEQVLKETRQSRNAYINEAVAHYNRVKRRASLAEQLARESLLVRESSAEVLKEMEKLESDYDY